MLMMKEGKSILVQRQGHILNIKIYAKEFIKSLKSENLLSWSFMEAQCF